MKAFPSSSNTKTAADLPPPRVLHSKSMVDMPLVDLRLTRPPESMRLKPLNKDNSNSNKATSSSSSSANKTTVDPFDFEGRSERMKAMVKNFCNQETGLLIDEINLQQYMIDSGETVTDATVQELCTVRPTITRLDLTDCHEVTDVSLWAIARHLVHIKTLVLSGCHQISHVGLRSLSLRLLDVTELDMSHCRSLDDLTMTVIASGCWHLERLTLRGCLGITDTGVGKVAKASERLTFLDLNGCTAVGEFGDHALKEIGAFCSQLRTLDLSGCKRVEDGGLRAVAQGCPQLEELMLAGCDGITGKGFRALFKYGRSLRTLHLMGSKHLADRDLEPLHTSPLRHTLTDIDFSGCKNLTDRGVAAISQSIGRGLASLAVAKTRVTDHAAVLLAHGCSRLRALDLSFCPDVTEAGVDVLAKGVTGLTTLKLNGNGDRIDARFLGSFNLEFAVLALHWLGFQPRENAYQNIAGAELKQERMANALVIQCMWRRKLAYRKYWERRRWWLMRVVVTRFQANVRGHLQRIKFRKILWQVRRKKAATRIQAAFRKHVQERDLREALRLKRLRAFLNRKATLIQAGWEGMKSRRRVRAIRNDRANRALAEARRQVKVEFAALRVQTVVRILQAKKRVARLFREREMRRARAELEDRAVRPIQKIVRGRFGRKRAQERIAYLKLQELKWYKAREIQRVLRGYTGRKLVEPMRQARELQRINRKAVVIQRHFRGFRARLLAKVARAMNEWRVLQRRAAVVIQALVRGGLQVRRFRKMLEEKKQRERFMRAVHTVQRVFRGHKGKERRDIRLAQLRMDAMVQPLKDLLVTLRDEEARREMRLGDALKKDEGSDQELEDIEIELEQCNQTTARYTDCGRIVKGVTQRYLTKYLRVRLKELLESEREAQTVRRQDIYECRKDLRAVQREIRDTQRQLDPLTVGLVATVKKERTIRLRAMVRRKAWASSAIQAAARGALVRMAQQDPHRFHWIECLDEEQSLKPYYFNTVTEQTAWRMPLAFRYFVLVSSSRVPKG